MNLDALDRTYDMCCDFEKSYEKTMKAFEEAIMTMKKAVAENNDQERKENE